MTMFFAKKNLMFCFCFLLFLTKACPLGSYCPIAVLDEDSGVCEPFNYQLSPNWPNHTCGGADIWSDVQSNDNIFCPEGFYCPSTNQKFSCSSGHYCRLGSTSQQRCFQKSGCPPKSASENISIIGVLLMITLCFLLLIIYNFSDHIITYRERKLARSREVAAHRAREGVQARRRWKMAKDIARKHVVELQEQLSQTFSFKTPIHGSRTHKGDDNCMSVTLPSGSMINESCINDNLSESDVFGGEQLHTRSQIFRYAYGQLEKERALQQKIKDMTYSEVLSMATANDVKKRPLVELTFKDLSVRLRGSEKQLLGYVTGKLLPGHVAAIMGPSGAGKTTLLTALAGRASGCEVTGKILINGMPESLSSYKKLIGFVPQDDIVHGNLTVEENLWFSARCRLSAVMPKADKVLVVERVIESLGLQAIRNSFVGTVEKRGISGGQRKRVNVGLEMVMEPSLLMLDEPTSGLDSSSSQLLLRALHREALQGVNISMVVHQPSYALFNMFNDLILLAKGGLTVYHGPTKKVEEYFSSLGIIVPERINPPDYFIDILEGIVKPNITSSSHQLPVRWMLYNGYEVPKDLQHLIVFDAKAKTNIKSSSGVGYMEQCTVCLFEPSHKGYLQNKLKSMKMKFEKVTDLSNRVTPGILRQYKYYLGRVVKQWLREATMLGVDYLILCLAGVFLGTLVKVDDANFGILSYTYTVIAFSLLCKIGALRSFSTEKVHYWRESASGISSLAYFLSKDTVDLLNVFIKPILYLSMFYFFNNPRSSFVDNYFVLLGLAYCVTGIGYAFAISFQPGSAQLWSAMVPIVLTLVGMTKQGQPWLVNLCYPKWALEAFMIANAKRYSGVWLITRCGLLKEFGYNINRFNLCIFILFVYGLVFRCIAFLSLVILQKK